ncbi:hypothetical protein [Gordonia crocea]|uniref:Uncharacterized protein n=1 Tax=Gordonia crocea TaxID=589162 RepID=A0A7M4BQ71_9ACTN|nr:hypothetical protein [Gordonia crocea]GED96032.1 hypothetical protein nbrc107697_00710 [Gordonia crocea]
MATRNPSLPEYTRIVGRLVDGELTLRPATATYRPPDATAGPAPLTVDILNAASHVIGTGSLTRDPIADSRSFDVRGSIVLPDDAARLRFSGDDVTTVEQILTPSSPTVRLTRAPAAGSRVEGRARVAWEVSPDVVESWLRYSCDRGRTWMPLQPRTTTTSTIVDLNDLPGGSSCCFGVSVTSGIRTATAVSPLFSVALKPCVALITSPGDGTIIRTGRVDLIGNGWWREAAEVEEEALEWTSDRDGPLGSGTYVVVDLSPGRHVITLRAGSRGRVGEASTRVTVRG